MIFRIDIHVPDAHAEAVSDALHGGELLIETALQVADYIQVPGHDFTATLVYDQTRDR